MSERAATDGNPLLDDEEQLPDMPEGSTEGATSMGGYPPKKNEKNGWGLTKDEVFAAATCLFYVVTAIGMGFVNKAVLMTPFTQSNVMLLMQQVVTTGLILGGKQLGVVSVRPLDWVMAQKSLGVVLLYNANVAFALGALSKMNIPMYSVLKRLTPCFVLAYKSCGRGDRPSASVTGAVLLTVVSTLIAGAGDLSFDMTGYLYGLTSCALQCFYLVLVEKTGTEKELDSTELMLYNGILSAPFLLLVTTANGEMTAAGPALAAAQEASSSFWVLLGLTLVGGSLLNYALFLCTMTNNALTTTIMGHVKTVLSTGLGFFLLGGVTATPLLVVGIACNTIGGLWYGYAKHVERLAKGAVAGDGFKPLPRPPANA